MKLETITVHEFLMTYKDYLLSLGGIGLGFVGAMTINYIMMLKNVWEIKGQVTSIPSKIAEIEKTMADQQATISFHGKLLKGRR